MFGPWPAPLLFRNALTLAFVPVLLLMLTAAAQLSGIFNGSLTTTVNGSNWFDSANGKVPAGYGNSNTSGTNIPLSDTSTEFGAADDFTKVEVDLQSDGSVLLTTKVTPGADQVLTGFAPLANTITITSDAFKNYKIIQLQDVANTTKSPSTATLNGTTLTITTSAGAVVTKNTTYVVKWQLYVSAAP